MSLFGAGFATFMHRAAQQMKRLSWMPRGPRKLVYRPTKKEIVENMDVVQRAIYEGIRRPMKGKRPQKPLAGLRHFRGEGGHQLSFLRPTDSTPNRFSYQRLLNGKRRPRIKYVNKHTGHFEYLPAFREQS